MHIEFREKLDSTLSEIIDFEFNKFADANSVQCNYTPFCFVAREKNKVLAVLSGHTYYHEVHISDFIVLEAYRRQHIGSRLLTTVENHFKDRGFNNINLTTYAFQAPEFYQKFGFQIEFIRENTENPKLTKYFLIKKFPKAES